MKATSIFLVGQKVSQIMPGTFELVFRHLFLRKLALGACRRELELLRKPSEGCLFLVLFVALGPVGLGTPEKWIIVERESIFVRAGRADTWHLSGPAWGPHWGTNLDFIWTSFGDQSGLHFEVILDLIWVR